MPKEREGRIQVLISNGDDSLFFRITSLGDERKTEYHLYGDGDVDSLPQSP